MDACIAKGTWSIDCLSRWMTNGIQYERNTNPITG